MELAGGRQSERSSIAPGSTASAFLSELPALITASPQRTAGQYGSAAPPGAASPPGSGRRAAAGRCGAASCRGWGRSCPQCRRPPWPEPSTAELRRWAAAVLCAYCWLLRFCLPAPSPRPTSRSAKVSENAVTPFWAARSGPLGGAAVDLSVSSAPEFSGLSTSSFGRISPEQPEK